ncbi:MAG: GNAT family N-acetyltransferase [Oscillospiraceae bacterium]|jgi:RimJ/RimL family protein N-acetyltransferase|nr:GNAT family N-acetyltransferase [Oscillospiraceae bacterium]
MRYFKKIAGERVYLSPVNPEDLALYTKWINDPGVAKYIGQYSHQFSLPKERETLERMATSDDDHAFAIVLNDGDRLLGNVGINQINRNYRHGVLGVFIGEAEDRSQGFGAEAIRLVLGYAFGTLNLHSVELFVHGDNARAIRCYEKVGFRVAGRVREAIFVGGHYVDRISMEILESEYDAG